MKTNHLNNMVPTRYLRESLCEDIGEHTQGRFMIKLYHICSMISLSHIDGTQWNPFKWRMVGDVPFFMAKIAVSLSSAWFNTTLRPKMKSHKSILGEPDHTNPRVCCNDLGFGRTVRNAALQL